MQKHNQIPTLGQNTSVGAIQAQPETHQSKAVVTGLAQGATAPMVRAHYPQLHQAPPFSGSAFNARGGGCMRCFLKYLSKPTILKL